VKNPAKSRFFDASIPFSGKIQVKKPMRKKCPENRKQRKKRYFWQYVFILFFQKNVEVVFRITIASSKRQAETILRLCTESSLARVISFSLIS
jgi:hypothetical protein